jgi:hypothetical protein
MFWIDYAVYVSPTAASDSTGQWLDATNRISCCLPGAPGPDRRIVAFSPTICFRCSVRSTSEEES